MKNRIASISTLLLLLAGAALAVAPAEVEPSPDASQVQRFAALDAETDSGLGALSTEEMAQTTGTGEGTDFFCGLATGVGYALVFSGVGIPVGAVVGGLGVICAMYF